MAQGAHDPNTQVQLTLPLVAVNQILEILAQKPYVEVAQLIGSISMQAQQQLENLPKKVEP